jgi:hypothetical protein
MKMFAKVVVATRQQHVATWVSTLAVGMCPDAILFKFVMNEDRQVAL